LARICQTNVHPVLENQFKVTMPSAARCGQQSEASSGDVQHLDARFFKTKLCAFHILGRCSRGMRCTFAHTQENLAAPPDLRCTRPCRYFSARGGCRKGAACSFAHKKEERSPRVAPSLSSVPEVAAIPENMRMRWPPGVQTIVQQSRPGSQQCVSLKAPPFEDKNMSDDSSGADSNRPLSRQSTTFSEQIREPHYSDDDEEEEEDEDESRLWRETGDDAQSKQLSPSHRCGTKSWADLVEDSD